MKILQITPTLCMGGAETMCENLTNNLIKLGQEVVVISLYDRKTPISERLESNGVKIHYLGKKKGLDFSMISKLKKIMKAEKPDVVHSHNNSMQYVVFAAMLAKIKNRVHTVHSVAQRELGTLAKKLAKHYYKRHKLVPVALSENIKNTVIDVYGLPENKIHVVLNGVDFSRCTPKNDYSAKDNFTVLHIGRFADVKNHPMLLSAFKSFHEVAPNSRLRLIGDGEGRAECERFVEENGLTECVEFLGIQSNVYGFLHDADIFTLPSKYEGIPMTLIEAMGTALPIVATNVGGIPDMLVNEESALLVDADEKQLCDAFIKLYSDSALRERLGESALEASKRFSAEEMARKYIEVYRSNEEKV